MKDGNGPEKELSFPTNSCRLNDNPIVLGMEPLKRLSAIRLLKKIKTDQIDTFIYIYGDMKKYGESSTFRFFLNKNLLTNTLMIHEIKQEELYRLMCCY